MNTEATQTPPTENTPNPETGEGTFDMPESLGTSYMSGLSGVTSARSTFESVTRTAEQDDSVLFEQLVNRHKDRLYRVAYRMTGNPEEAQDLLQDAIVEAFRAFAHFRKGTYFDKWLYRIMSRTFIDRKRSQKRVRMVSLDEPLFAGDGESGGYDREIADETADPARQLQTSVLDQRIQEGLERLTPDYRLVLILSDIEEFSYDEVAAFLDCPIGTVRSRLHRARSQMRQHLTKSGYCA